MVKVAESRSPCSSRRLCARSWIDACGSLPPKTGDEWSRRWHHSRSGWISHLVRTRQTDSKADSRLTSSEGIMASFLVNKLKTFSNAMAWLQVAFCWGLPPRRDLFILQEELKFLTRISPCRAILTLTLTLTPGIYLGSEILSAIVAMVAQQFPSKSLSQALKSYLR